MFRTFELSVSHIPDCKVKKHSQRQFESCEWISKLPFLMTPFAYATPFQEDTAIHKSNTMIIRAPTKTCIIYNISVVLTLS